MNNKVYLGDLPYGGRNSDCIVYDKDHHPTKLLNDQGVKIADWDKEKMEWVACQLVHTQAE